jgi:hypothetical protein
MTALLALLAAHLVRPAGRRSSCPVSSGLFTLIARTRDPLSDRPHVDPDQRFADWPWRIRWLGAVFTPRPPRCDSARRHPQRASEGVPDPTRNWARSVYREPRRSAGAYEELVPSRQRGLRTRGCDAIGGGRRRHRLSGPGVRCWTGRALEYVVNPWVGATDDAEAIAHGSPQEIEDTESLEAYAGYSSPFARCRGSASCRAPLAAGVWLTRESWRQRRALHDVRGIRRCDGRLLRPGALSLSIVPIALLFASVP